MCVCVCALLGCGLAAKAAICSLSVLQKASVSIQAPAGELMAGPQPFLLTTKEHTAPSFCYPIGKLRPHYAGLHFDKTVELVSGKDVVCLQCI